MDVSQYIEDNIEYEELKLFLQELFNSTLIKRKLLCICILIEIKYGTFSIDFFLELNTSIKENKHELNFENFIKLRENCLTHQFMETKPLYSRIISRDVFMHYIGDFSFSTPYIQKDKVLIHGWSSKNEVVWITPKNEIDKLIDSVAEEEHYKSNDICDYLGIPREFDDLTYYKIDYSGNFNEKIFQPNSSNVLWDNEYVFFVSYKQEDNYGRTYNECGSECAKEQIHFKSYYFDELFSVNEIGLSCGRFPVLSNNIIDHAINILKV